MLDAIARDLLSLVVPPACAACRAPPESRHEVLCAACRRAMPWLADPCPRCALPRCGGACPRTRPVWDRAWSPVAYDGPARALLIALKFHGALPLADHLASMLLSDGPAGMFANAAVVPVPAGRRRRRARGYDPAALIAVGLARRAGLELSPCLTRAGPDARQLGASRDARLAGGRIAIGVAGPAPAAAILVDDVHTTGATLDACALALRRAGTRRIEAVSFARSL